MKRRVAVFTVVWAYAACWLWLPLAGYTTVTALHFFPPGYFFALGALFGIGHELLASRFKRLFATLAVLPLALELGHCLYNGNALGFLLGGILAVAVIPASFVACRLRINRTLAVYMAAFSGIGAMLWPIAAGYDSTYAGEARISPNGIFTAQSINDSETLTTIVSVRVDLKNAPMGAFGRDITPSCFDDYCTVKSFQWTNLRTLGIKLEVSVENPSPSLLFPFQISYRRQGREAQTQVNGLNP